MSFGPVEFAGRVVQFDCRGVAGQVVEELDVRAIQVCAAQRTRPVVVEIELPAKRVHLDRIGVDLQRVGVGPEHHLHVGAVQLAGGHTLVDRGLDPVDPSAQLVDVQPRWPELESHLALIEDVGQTRAVGLDLANGRSSTAVPTREVDVTGEVMDGETKRIGRARVHGGVMGPVPIDRPDARGVLTVVDLGLLRRRRPQRANWRDQEPSQKDWETRDSRVRGHGSASVLGRDPTVSFPKERRLSASATG